VKQEYGIHQDARKRGAPPSPSQPLRQRIAHVYSSKPRSILTCPVNSLHQSTVSGLAGLCLGARSRCRCRSSATISARMTCQHSLILLSWPRIVRPFVIDVLSRILCLVPFCLVPEFRVSSLLTCSPYCPFFPPTYTTAPFPTFYFIIIYFRFRAPWGTETYEALHIRCRLMIPLLSFPIMNFLPFPTYQSAT